MVVTGHGPTGQYMTLDPAAQVGTSAFPSAYAQQQSPHRLPTQHDLNMIAASDGPVPVSPTHSESHSHRHHHHHQHRHQASTGSAYGVNGPIPTPIAQAFAASSSDRAPLNSQPPVDPAQASYYRPTRLPGDDLPGHSVTSSEEWKTRGAATIVRSSVDLQGHKTTQLIKKGVQDFEFGKTLGEGSYSTVVAASDRQTLHEYAIKVLDKRHIIKEQKVKYVNIEKNTLNRLGDHPGIIRLYYTFQDENSLYFVLDFASNGELLSLIKQMGSLDEECTRYYGAQILDAVDYMHSKGVIHRDLKPENILLDRKMRIKITDFGTAKLLEADRDQDGNEVYPEVVRANSFVGTAEYVSPELLTDKATDKGSDLWAFGCVVYQMIAGRPPFKASNEYLTFQKIVRLQYSYPPGFPYLVRDLCKLLLVLNPKQRASIKKIKSHEFFASVDWSRSALWKRPPPRIMPYRPSARSVTNPRGTTNPRAAAAASVSAPPSRNTSGPYNLHHSVTQATPQPTVKPQQSVKPPLVSSQSASPLLPAHQPTARAKGIPSGGVRASVAAAVALGSQASAQQRATRALQQQAASPKSGVTQTSSPSQPAPKPRIAPVQVVRTQKPTRPIESIAGRPVGPSRIVSAPVPQIRTANGSGSRTPVDTAPSSPRVAQGSPSSALASPKLHVPPASQLDAEWASILTHHEERILKVGTVQVLANGSSGLHEEDDREPGRLTKFFGGAANKRKRRIAIVTSAARLLIIGDDKKPRLEMSLASPHIHVREFPFNKRTNTGTFAVESGNRILTLEDNNSTSEWIQAIELSREYYQQAIALSESNAMTAATAAALAVSGSQGRPVQQEPTRVTTSTSTFLQKHEARRGMRRSRAR